MMTTASVTISPVAAHATYSLLGVLAFALVPVAAMALGSASAAVRPPGPRGRSAIQHFAAGVILAVVVVELFPDIMRLHPGALEVAGGFTGGFLLMLGVEWVTKAHEHRMNGHEPKNALRLIIPIGLDLVLDGVLLAVAFAAGATEGVLLAAALACELISVGLALTVDLRESRHSKTRAILIPVALAAVTLIGGASVGSALPRLAGPAGLAAILAFGTSALLFLVIEELLVEAHEQGETPAGTGMFFVGFLVLLTLVLL